MSQSTSALWQELWRTPGTLREYGFDINGVWYGPEQEVQHAVDYGLYEEFGFGNAACATLTLELYADDIPYGATIKRYIRLVNGDRQSEWLPKGIFYANHRPADDGYWTIEAFDAMRKADVKWKPDQNLVFPLPMPDAVNEFCRIMGVELDPRTVLNPAYTIDYPFGDDPDSEGTPDEGTGSTNAYLSIREELRYIAAAHGGNWIMTDEGKLRLVGLLSIPPETHYMVTQHGDAIVMGGVRLLV